MTRLEERIRTGLQETAECIPDTAPTRSTKSHRPTRPGGLWIGIASVIGVLILFVPILLLRGTHPDSTAGGDPGPFLGTWATESGTSWMVIEASSDGSVEMQAVDFAAVCGAAGSTMMGSGQLEAESQLVFPAPVLTCDDGGRPGTLNDAAVEEELHNLTFTHDAATTEIATGARSADTLTDNFGSVWTRESFDSRRITPPSEAEMTELLDGFVAARVAGEGADEYLDDSEEIPLLYATTSGAPYERGDFEQLSGIEWPYGLIAYRVRLFAGDIVVEQLFFAPHDDLTQFPDDGRLVLGYDPDGYGTEIAPTTEDGLPVATSVDVFDGALTLHVAHPWIWTNGIQGRLIPQGDVAPTIDGGQRHDGWDLLSVIADPTVGETGCGTAGPVDAEALAARLQSYPGLKTTAPLAVSVGGAEALVMDVVTDAGAPITVAVDDQYNGCAHELLNPILDTGTGSSMTVVTEGVMRGQATGDRMRLYLVDMPEGSSMRSLAIAITAPESRFDRAMEEAAQIVDSVEIHAR